MLEGVEEPICDLYLRVMFLLLDFVVEGEYTLEEHEYAAKKLRELFIEGQSKFANDAEFSFFSGIIIYIGERYFGMESAEPANLYINSHLPNYQVSYVEHLSVRFTSLAI